MYALSGGSPHALGGGFSSGPSLAKRAWLERLRVWDSWLPSWFGLWASVFYFLFCFSYGLFLGGYQENFVYFISDVFGFQLRHVDVVGAEHVSVKEVLRRLDLPAHPSLLALDINKISKTLAVLPWVGEVEVQKIYPHTCRIFLRERVPYAVWQHNYVKDIVDENGAVIMPFLSSASDVASLPLLVGEGAAVAAKSFLSDLQKKTKLMPRVKAFMRVGMRRWDVFLASGVCIKLPEEQPIKRLQNFFSSPQQAALLKKAVTEIDLRIPGKIAVTLRGGKQNLSRDGVKTVRGEG